VVLGNTFLDQERNEEMTELQISQIKETVKQYEQNGRYTLTG
jgi:hypothetical protein